MSRTDTKATAGGGALDSVRRLEERLEDRRGAEEAARARLEAAREEAERILQEAREGAEREAADKRRGILSRADGEAEGIVSRAGEHAEMLRRISAEDRPAAAREVVGLILPRRDA